jgi:hypothetical protein
MMLDWSWGVISRSAADVEVVPALRLANASSGESLMNAVVMIHSLRRAAAGSPRGGRSIIADYVARLQDRAHPFAYNGIAVQEFRIPANTVGEFEAMWDLRDRTGQRVSNGVEAATVHRIAVVR